MVQKRKTGPKLVNGVKSDKTKAKGEKMMEVDQVETLPSTDITGTTNDAKKQPPSETSENSVPTPVDAKTPESDGDANNVKTNGVEEKKEQDSMITSSGKVDEPTEVSQDKEVEPEVQETKTRGRKPAVKSSSTTSTSSTRSTRNGKTAEAPAPLAARGRKRNVPEAEDMEEKKGKKAKTDKAEEKPVPETTTRGSKRAAASSKSAESIASTKSVPVAESVEDAACEEEMEVEEAEVKEKKTRGRKPAASKAAPVAAKQGSSKRPASAKASVAKKTKTIEFVKAPITREGVVLTLGMGDVGQLGLGPDVMEKRLPALVADGIPEEIIEMYAGGMHTACRANSGSVYTFGCNDEGALGRVTSDEDENFTSGKVDLPGKAVGISCGDSHTAALLDDGRVFAWGSFRDSSGTMGLTSAGVVHSPVEILPKVTVIKITSGCDHLVMLTEEGDLYTCGNAEQGQLGRVAEIFATRGGRKGISYLLDPAPVHFQKSRGKNKVQFQNVWAGFYSTFARVKDSDKIYVFGLNNYNQLGLEDRRPHHTPVICNSFCGKSWTRISPGQHHTVAIDEDGAVFTVGRREYGALGLGSDRMADAQVPTQVTGLEKCVDVAAGIQVCYAVTEPGTVFAWGANNSNQLGIRSGDDDDKWEPVKMMGQAIDTRNVFSVSSGGQHAVFLATAATSGADAESKIPSK